MTYKNLEIKLNNNNMFYCDEFELEAETYKELTKLIDKELSKEKKEFKRIPVIVSVWNFHLTQYIDAEITSMVGNGRSVWVTRKDKHREKKSIADLYEQSETNLKIISEIKVMQNKISELEESLKSKRNSLTKIKLN